MKRSPLRNLVNELPTKWQLLATFIVDLTARFSNRTIGSAGLVIKAGGSAIVKAGTAFHVLVSDGKVGRLRAVAINTDMPALVGTVVNATHNVFAFFIDRTGTLSSSMGVAGASLAAVTFPVVPAGSVCLGYIHVNPTGTGNFVGGTTPLDDATVVPNVVYRNIDGSFDPEMVP